MAQWEDLTAKHLLYHQSHHGSETTSARAKAFSKVFTDCEVEKDSVAVIEFPEVYHKPIARLSLLFFRKVLSKVLPSTQY